MDQPRHVRLLFTALFISQVCGIPTFWSQPDCYQNQFSDVPYSYDNYQGPSYQETIQNMVEETLRAISEIVQITAKATKQELASLSNIFYQSRPTTDCDNSGDTGNSPEDFQFTNPQQPAQFPGQSVEDEYTNPIEPLNENPVVAELPVATVTKKPNSTLQTPAIVNNKIDGGDVTTASISSETDLVSTEKNKLELESSTDKYTSAEPQSSSSEGPVLNNTLDVEQNTPVTNSEEEVSLSTSPPGSADDLNALLFTPIQYTTDSVTEDTTGTASTLVDTTTSSAFDTSMADVSTKASRKPKL